MDFAKLILEAIQDYQLKYFALPPGEIRLSIADAQRMFDESGRRRKNKRMKHNDTGVLWGRPFRVDKHLDEGCAVVADREVRR